MSLPKITTLSLCLVMLLGGCAKEIDSDLYTEENFGEASNVYHGVIINVRKVKMQQGDKLENNKTGKAVGALSGAVIGSQFGGGSAKWVTGAAGGIGGAFLGSLAEKKLKSQDALEYIVKLADGTSRSIVQGLNPYFAVGQKVLVMMNKYNRSRIIADNS